MQVVGGLRGIFKTLNSDTSEGLGYRLRALYKLIQWKRCSGVDWGLSRRSSMQRPRSEDPLGGGILTFSLYTDSYGNCWIWWNSNQFSTLNFQNRPTGSEVRELREINSPICKIWEKYNLISQISHCCVGEGVIHKNSPGKCGARVFLWCSIFVNQQKKLEVKRG